MSLSDNLVEVTRIEKPIMNVYGMLERSALTGAMLLTAPLGNRPSIYTKIFALETELSLPTYMFMKS